LTRFDGGLRIGVLGGDGCADLSTTNGTTRSGSPTFVRRKAVSPHDLLEAAIERVEARNAAVNAVVMPLYDYGRKAIEDGLPNGPFRGVPFLLKDLGGWLAGVKVTRGSRFFADAPAAAADSEHVRRLKHAGLVIFGRTNSLGWNLHGGRRHPVSTRFGSAARRDVAPAN
jgi:Asp-tRNA(Asn)/Glu-tRNA(Gln) amidotransferase A subunit family amidase